MVDGPHARQPLRRAGRRARRRAPSSWSGRTASASSSTTRAGSRPTRCWTRTSAQGARARVQEAYAVPADPEQRRAYDASLGERRAEAPSCAWRCRLRRRPRSRRPPRASASGWPSRSPVPRCARFREARGVSLARDRHAPARWACASSSTSSRTATALLPAAVYLRGFLQEYARVRGPRPPRHRRRLPGLRAARPRQESRPQGSSSSSCSSCRGRRTSRTAAALADSCSRRPATDADRLRLTSGRTAATARARHPDIVHSERRARCRRARSLGPTVRLVDEPAACGAVRRALVSARRGAGAGARPSRCWATPPARASCTRSRSTSCASPTWPALLGHLGVRGQPPAAPAARPAPGGRAARGQAHLLPAAGRAHPHAGGHGPLARGGGRRAAPRCR